VNILEHPDKYRKASQSLLAAVPVDGVAVTLLGKASLQGKSCRRTMLQIGCLQFMGIVAWTFVNSLSPAFADEQSAAIPFAIPELICDGDRPSTRGYTVVERMKGVVLWENARGWRDAGYIMVDSVGCYVAFNASGYAVTRLDEVLDANFASFELQTAISPLLAAYKEEIVERVAKRCENESKDEGSSSYGVGSEYDFCRMRVIRSFSARGGVVAV
jgi:hypothetical protein